MKTHTIGRTTSVMAALVASTLFLAACGSGGGTGAESSEGSVASTIDLKGVNIAVGSKEYPEQKILGQMLVQSLQAAGATVADKTGLSGTQVVRKALTTGEIDVYYEYTGTAWLTFFQKTQPITDPEELFDEVSAIDQTNGISWFALGPFNNTYGLGASADAAKSTGVTSISEYAELANNSPEDATLCTSAEFRTREDGLPGLEKKYDFTLPQSSLFNVEQTVIYQAIEKGECDFMYLVSTDSRLVENGIVSLEDDKSFFPVYNPAVNMTTEVYDAHKKQYDKLFGAISELLTQETILELNGAVEVDGLPPAKVVNEWLKKSGII